MIIKNGYKYKTKDGEVGIAVGYVDGYNARLLKDDWTFLWTPIIDIEECIGLVIPLDTVTDLVLKKGNKYMQANGEVVYITERAIDAYWGAVKADGSPTQVGYYYNEIVMDLGKYSPEELPKPKLEVKVGHKYLNSNGTVIYILSKVKVYRTGNSVDDGYAFKGVTGVGKSTDEYGIDGWELPAPPRIGGRAITMLYPLVEDLGPFKLV